ncbi:MAG TPA: hypothetical protein VL588_11575, partial [Bdellovibrionota bacterium]|nr:hypothetical protein [Bdellovibrionota bacterium]
SGGFQALDFLRVELNAATLFWQGESYAAGLAYVANPENHWSPVLGVSIARSHLYDVSFIEPTRDRQIWSAAAKVGIDYQATLGLRFGATLGWDWTLSSPQPLPARLVPQVQIGWAI